MLLVTYHLEIPKLSESPVPNLGEAVKGKTFNVQRKKRREQKIESWNLRDCGDFQDGLESRPNLSFSKWGN